MAKIRVMTRGFRGVVNDGLLLFLVSSLFNGMLHDLQRLTLLKAPDTLVIKRRFVDEAPKRSGSYSMSLV